jgi:hypothetical protein
MTYIKGKFQSSITKEKKKILIRLVSHLENKHKILLEICLKKRWSSLLRKLKMSMKTILAAHLLQEKTKKLQNLFAWIKEKKYWLKRWKCSKKFNLDLRSKKTHSIQIC